jgi:hypothetical protein
MGHDFITYGQRHVHLHDWDIWLLRHLLLTEAQVVTPSDVSADEATLESLRSFIAAWRWIGPGVVMGTELNDFIQNQATRRDILLSLLHRTITRLERMGEVIPLDHLKKHVDKRRGVTFGKEQQTRRFIKALEQLREMLRPLP